MFSKFFGYVTKARVVAVAAFASFAFLGLASTAAQAGIACFPVLLCYDDGMVQFVDEQCFNELMCYYDGEPWS